MDSRRHAGKAYRLGLFVVAFAFCVTSMAQRPPPRHLAPHWRGDIARFHENDWIIWRGGRWVHAPHGGRIGWWWVAGGQWYLYPAPVYPYPNPWEPPPPAVLPPLPPPTQHWYYCEAPQGYYPYVPNCPGGWKQVPAMPGDIPGSPSR